MVGVAPWQDLAKVGGLSASSAGTFAVPHRPIMQPTPSPARNAATTRPAAVAIGKDLEKSKHCRYYKPWDPRVCAPSIYATLARGGEQPRVASIYPR